jgi:peptidoglycan/xylan/chitin deacetylase (PgdA/CDA1 family)
MGRVLSAQYLKQAFRFSGVTVLLNCLKTWQGVLSLNYHRIGDGRDSIFDRGLWSATPEGFDRQIALLKTHCDVIAPPDVKDVVAKGRGRYALVTFDDGYRDNYEQAFPILKSHGVPGTFFVTTGFLDRPCLPWWDEIAWMVRSCRKAAIPAGGWLIGDVPLKDAERETAVRTLLRKFKSLPHAETGRYIDYLAEVTGSGRFAGGDLSELWMTWEMLREMRSVGMCIGGHTVNHPVLARLPIEGQATEIAECKQRLEAELGGPMQFFSYPVGGPTAFNQDTRTCLHAEGVELAFSYYGGFRRFNDADPYDVPRVAIEQWSTDADLTALLALPQVFA